MTTIDLPRPRNHPSYAAHRDYAIATGRWQPYVNAQPVREHVASVMAYGITCDGIARLTGVSRNTVRQLMEGVPWRGREPSTRLLRKTAAALMTARFDLDVFPDTFMISGAGTNRRVQALTALGYTFTYQAERMGRTLQEISDLAVTPRVSAGLARRVRDMYAELSMRLPTDVPRSNYARKTAAKYGWLPPLAWDDDLIDLPDEALEKALAEQVAGMDRAELAAAWTAHYKHGDKSPLIVAAAREYKRLRKAEALARAGVAA